MQPKIDTKVYLKAAQIIHQNLLEDRYDAVCPIITQVLKTNGVETLYHYIFNYVYNDSNLDTYRPYFNKLGNVKLYNRYTQEHRILALLFLKEMYDNGDI